MCIKRIISPVMIVSTVSALVLVLSTPGHAGVMNDLTVGVYGGYTLAGSPDISSGVINQGIMKEAENSPDFLAGVEAGYRLHTISISSMPAHIGVSLGVEYFRRGYDAVGEKLYIDGDDQIIKAGPSGSFSADYLGIPVQVRMGLDIHAGSFIIRPSILTGLEPAMLLSAVYTHDYSGKSINVKGNSSSVNLYVPAGLGIDVDLPFGIISLKAIYSFDLLPAGEVTVKTSSLLEYPWDFSIPEYRHSSLYVTLGYTFKFTMINNDGKSGPGFNRKNRQGGKK